MTVNRVTAEKILDFFCLGKMKIAFFTAFSGVAVFFCSPAPEMAQAVFLFGGIWALAAGASALNQYQERDIDARMPRTKDRPIPAGRIGAGQALAFSLILAGAGMMTLMTGVGFRAALLGAGALAWYNGLYTWLKRKSACAIVPGALAGVLPPLIGWMTGGGALFDRRLLYLSLFFFLWQIPHALVVIIRYGKEFTAAGLPSLTGTFTDRQLRRIATTWIFAVGIACLFLPLFGFSSPASLGVAGPGAAFLWSCFSGIRLFRGRVIPYAGLIKSLNGVMTIMLIALATQKGGEIFLP